MQEYKEYHTDTEVHFQLFFTPTKMQEVLSGGGPHQKLKLVGKASLGMSCYFVMPIHAAFEDMQVTLRHN